MNKKIILFGVVMIMLVGIVNATAQQDRLSENTLAYYTLDADSGLDNKLEKYNATVDGTYLDGKIGRAVELQEASTDEILIQTNLGTFTGSLCFWYNGSGASGGDYFFDDRDNGGSAYAYFSDSNTISGDNCGNMFVDTVDTQDVNLNSYHHVCFVGCGFNIASFLTIGRRYADGGGWGYIDNADFDEIAVFNITLNSSDMSYLYNSGDGIQYLSPPGSASSDYLNITSTTPANNTQFSTNTINLNTTVNSTYDFNCTLYINGTSNQTITGYSAGSDIAVSFNATLGDGKWNHTISCFNNATQKNTTTNTFFVDSVFPIITSNFVNRSFAYNSITAQFNFTDDQSLFSYNISIDGVDVNNSGNILDTTLNITYTHNISNFSIGWHTLNVKVADGHTAKELKGDYKFNNGLFNDYAEFEVYSGNKIKIQADDSSWFDDWSVTKLTDRYSFDYKPSKLKSKYKFTITSQDAIQIIEKEDTPWKKWLVIGEHWLDFYPFTDVDISKVKDNEVSVTLNNVDKTLETLSFNSIGDLNVYSVNYSFYKTNLTAIYSDSVFETQEQTMTFNISKQSLTYSTTASLVYDGTSKSLSKFTNSDHDFYTVTFDTPNADSVSEIKNFTFSFDLSNSSEVILSAEENFTQTVYQINIDNCSNSSYTPALNIFLKDEVSDEAVTGNVNIDLDVWYEDEGLFREFSWGLTGANNYSICIYPNSSSYLINSVMEYSAVNKSDRKYYLLNYSLDNTTDSIYLYLLNNSLTTEVQLKVYDTTTGQSVEGAYIKILRYYPQGNDSNSGGVYKTVEIERTDTAGEALGKLVLNDVFYKFIVDYNGITRLNTEVSRIISTLKVLPITLFTDVFESAEKIGFVDISVTCDETTKICRVIWDDDQNIVQTVVFEVYRNNMFGKQLIYSDETSSPSGSMVYTITEDTTGNTYKAVAHIHTNTEYSWYDNVAQAILNFKVNFSSWGGSNVLFPLLLLMVAMAFLFLEVAGATGIIIGTLIVFVLMSLLGIIQLSWYNIMILIALGGILIAKMRR